MTARVWIASFLGFCLAPLLFAMMLKGDVHPMAIFFGLPLVALCGAVFATIWSVIVVEFGLRNGFVWVAIFAALPVLVRFFTHPDFIANDPRLILAFALAGSASWYIAFWKDLPME